MKHTKTTRKEPDASLIQALGGPSKLAAMLGLSRPGGVQRVSNWQFRGIPAQVKVDHPDLFMPGRQPKRQRKSAASQGVAK